MKVRFDLVEMERNVLTIELPDEIDVSKWTPAQMMELGEAAYSAHYFNPYKLDRLVPGWKYTRISQGETDHEIEGYFIEGMHENIKGNLKWPR